VDGEYNFTKPAEIRRFNSNNRIDVTKPLQQLREEFDKSQRELATVMGISKTTLTRLEKKCLNCLTFNELFAVSLGLGIDPEKLLISLLTNSQREKVFRSNLQTPYSEKILKDIKVSYLLKKNPFICAQLIEIGPYAELKSSTLRRGIFSFILMFSGKMTFQSSTESFLLRKKDHLALQRDCFFTIYNSDQLVTASFLHISAL